MHYAAHEPIDVAEIGCDVLLCSPYKFCGPHLGIAYVRRELAESLAPVQGAAVGERRRSGASFETGTLPYELLAGFSATIAYLDSIGGMEVISATTSATLGEHLLANLPEQRDALRPADDGGARADVPLQRRRACPPTTSRAPARASAGSGSGTPTTGTASRSAPRLPEQSLRAGIAHYNTRDEVDRLLDELARL